MKFYFIEPEVAGGLGRNTVMDGTFHPPRVNKLHYEFSGWLGDALVESFPCFIVTRLLADLIYNKMLSGVSFDTVEVSIAGSLEGRHGDLMLPEFIWLKIDGLAGADDFGISQDLRLVVSEEALSLIKPLCAASCDVSDFE